MTSFNSPEEFLRALEQNPEWRESVRALILSEELLRLPVQFIAFFGRVSAFIDQTEAFISEQRQFNAEQKQFNENFARRLSRIEGDIGNFRGAYARDSAIRNAAAIAADMGLDYLRIVPHEELVRMSRSVTGDIPTSQLRSFRDADLVIEASDGSATHFIAVESSYTADQRDSDRAQRNSRLLAEITGQTAHAVIASVRNDQHANSQVSSGTISWFQLQDRNSEPE